MNESKMKWRIQRRRHSSTQWFVVDVSEHVVADFYGPDAEQHARMFVASEALKAACEAARLELHATRISEQTHPTIPIEQRYSHANKEDSWCVENAINKLTAALALLAPPQDAEKNKENQQ